MDHVVEDCGGVKIAVDCVTLEKDNVPTDKSAFYAFPKAKGWKVEHDHKLELRENSSSPMDFDNFLQAWLFFGLILTVVQKNGKPILKFHDLHDENLLDTKKLRSALDEWTAWEMANIEGIGFRMIQVDLVLDKARQVVRKNCGYNLENEQVEYAVHRDDEGHEARHITDENVLALMILGETLSAVKLSIVEHSKIKMNISGWHGDDDDGWGPPRYVFEAMRKGKWCQRAVHLLKGQLRSNATMLLAAWFAYHGSDRMTKGHESCTPSECKGHVKGLDGKYTNCHIPPCEGDCDMVGPKIQEVCKILQAGDQDSSGGIPLLEFSAEDKNCVTMKVKPLNEGEAFAAISHVWSDGWGNETENKLHACQLRFIRRQLRRAHNDRDVPFWMDTLVVPVGIDAEEVKRLKEEGIVPTITDKEEVKRLKKKAIGQIFKVFKRSSFTIILDNGLCAMDPGENGKPAQAAMKILASGWMRRLWTLQEAFVSQKLYITFKEKGKNYDNLKNLDDLKKKLLSPKDALASPLMKMVRDHLLHNLMGDQRDERMFYLDKNNADRLTPPKDAAIMVVNVWRAARWRTTSNSAHETLALATLLDINYEDTEIENAGLTTDANPKQLDNLVTAFWKAFDKEYSGAIPSGIIFLPGKKVENNPGFGWAPRTWMSAHEVDYPDPFSRWTSPSKLHLGRGLAVNYPGFLLHTQNDYTRSSILGTDSLDNTFFFPVDRKLLEWYNAKPAEPEIPIPFVDVIVTAKTQLAIILCRPQPGESPAEIGLLVEIHSRTKRKTDYSNVPAEEFNCRIIRRMHVWRETRTNYLTGPGRSALPLDSENREPHQNEGAARLSMIYAGNPEDTDMKICIGEVVQPSQIWVVDGHDYSRHNPSETNGNIQAQQIPTQSHGKSIDKQEQPNTANISLLNTLWNIASRLKSRSPNAQPTSTPKTAESGPGSSNQASSEPPHGALRRQDTAYAF